MSTSTTSPYAVGQDPRLEKILERAKKIEEWIKYLESKAVHLQSVDRARSDDYFEEFEVAIELLLKDLVLDLWNAKGWTSDKISWSWSPPDYEADHRDFLGRLYCTLKLAEQIHEENSRLENFPIKLSPPPLEQMSSQDNKRPETFCSDTETSLTRLPRQLQQDDRHQKAAVRISEDLTEFSEVFKYYHSRLKKYVQEIRGHQGIQQELLNNTSPTSSHPITLPYPLSSSPPGELGRRESCLMRGKYSSLPRQDQAALNAEPGKEGSKRKRSEAVDKFEEGLKELSKTESENTQHKQRKEPEESVSDTPTEPWNFDPDREEFKELKDIRDEFFTYLVLMQENSDSFRKAVLRFANYDIEIKSKAESH